MIQVEAETFCREKSAWNNIVSGTREFWNFMFKTKARNFFEVRWRPISPKESFKDNIIHKQKAWAYAQTFLC